MWTIFNLCPNIEIKVQDEFKIKIHLEPLQSIAVDIFLNKKFKVQDEILSLYIISRKKFFILNNI